MLLRPSSRPRASAELGYRVLAGVVVGGIAELVGVALAKDANPDSPNLLLPSLVAVAVGVTVAIVDPPEATPVGQYQGDAWLSPDGRILPAFYGHADAAIDITDARSDDFSPTDEELRCCGADFLDEDQDEDDIPVSCLAEARLRESGYQRITGQYAPEIGFEIFSEPTPRQRDVLRRVVAGANLGRSLHIDVADDPCTYEETVMMSFTAPPNSVRERHEAIDKAIACVKGELAGCQ